MTSTFATLSKLDARLAASGVHALTPFWRDTLERWYTHPTAKSLVARVGRGGAKSFTSAKIALNEVLFGGFEIPVGEVHFFAFVARLKDEAAQRKRLLEDFLTRLKIPFDSHSDEIVLRDRRIGLRVFASNIASVSGFRCIGFAADELAKWQSADGYSNPAAEVLASLNAMTITHPRARKVLVSSPFGMVDYHFERIELGNTESQIVAQATSWVANPEGITEAQTHEAEPDHRIWLREYAAIPSSTESGAFDSEDATAAFGAPLEPAGERFIVTDPSDLMGDTWAWSVCSQTTKGGIAMLNIQGESQRVGTDEVVMRIARLAREHGARRIFGDQRNGAFLQPAFSKLGLQYTFYPWSMGSKDTAIYKIRHLMRERALALPNDDRLRREVLTLRARMTPSGGIAYNSNGVDYASCLIVLGHAIAAGDVKASAVTRSSTLADAMRSPEARRRLEAFTMQFAGYGWEQDI